MHPGRPIADPADHAVGRERDVEDATDAARTMEPGQQQQDQAASSSHEAVMPCLVGGGLSNVVERPHVLVR